MNIDVKEYIASGILEAYVLGTCSDKERAEVEHVVAMYPEVKKELNAIEDALGQYAMQHSITPSAGLKDKILGIIKEEEHGYEKPVISMNKMQYEEKADPRNAMIWSVAASVLLVVSLMGSLYIYNRMVHAEGYVNELSAKYRKKDSTLAALTAQLTQMKSDMSLMKDPANKMIVLKGMPKTPDAKAMVCFNTVTKQVYFEAEKMPEPPKGMQYQLWAMVDGKPVDEGMITMGDGMHKMKDIEGATAFAVTLEKQGGNPTPQGDMIVLGNVQS